MANSPCHSPVNILVTGGCGFIGSNFINNIFHKLPQSRIVNLDKLILNSDCTNVAKEIRESSRYKCVLVDLHNRPILGAILEENKVRIKLINFKENDEYTKRNK